MKETMERLESCITKQGENDNMRQRLIDNLQLAVTIANFVLLSIVIWQLKVRPADVLAEIRQRENQVITVRLVESEE